MKNITNTYHYTKRNRLQIMACFLLLTWMCVGYISFSNWDGPNQLIELAEEDTADKDEKEKDSICSVFTQKLITEPTYSSHGITLSKAWETPYLKKQTPPPNRA